jgi:non-canonical purine NTP pyrophosphatase (RdgB/HAM1 family)
MAAVEYKTTNEIWAPEDTVVSATASIARTFATTNAGKLAEFAAALGLRADELEGLKIDIPEHQPSNEQLELMREGKYEECTRAISAQKARDGFTIAGKDITVEDSGLYLAALKGLPGPSIKDWCKTGTLEELCTIAKAKQNPEASFVVAFSYYAGTGEVQTRSAVIHGFIAESPRGREGYGFDPIFIPDPEQQQSLFPGKGVRTYAEMSAEEKAQLSPRVMAINKMATERFEVPPAPPIIRVPTKTLSIARHDFQDPVPGEHVTRVTGACRSHVADRIARIRSEISDPEACRRLVLEGELPERVLDNDVPRIRSRMREFKPSHLRVFTADCAAQILANEVMRMELINHPLRLEAQLRTERLGYVPVRQKRVKVLDRLRENGEASTFDDFKLGYEGASTENTNLERIVGIMIQGLWTYSSTKQTTLFTCGSSVPSMNSAHAIATGAICGAQMFAPCDSYWTKAEAQDTLIKASFAALENHPFFRVGRFKDVILSNGQTVAQRVLERGKRLIGATLKARETEIAERTETLLNLGVQSFRPYEAGVTRTLQGSVRVMTAAHPGADMVIYAGQVGSVRQARECVEAGAHSLIVGIGDGDLCTTADVAATAADNPGRVYELVRANLGVPIGADGGVGSRASVAAALGAAFRIRAGALAGGTLSLRLVKMASSDGHEHIYDATAGEASAITKLRANQVDALGEPMNVEGTSAREPFDPRSPDMARRLWEDMAGIAKSIRFSGHNRDTLMALIHAPEPDVRILTQNAIRKGSPHPANGERDEMPVLIKPQFEELFKV